MVRSDPPMSVSILAHLNRYDGIVIRVVLSEAGERGMV